MPPVMITKPWPIAKSPKSPTRFAVLARLTGEMKRGLIRATTVADDQDQDEQPEVLLLHSALRHSRLADGQLEHRVLGEFVAVPACR